MIAGTFIIMLFLFVTLQFLLNNNEDVKVLSSIKQHQIGKVGLVEHVGIVGDQLTEKDLWLN